MSDVSDRVWRLNIRQASSASSPLRWKQGQSVPDHLEHRLKPLPRSLGSDGVSVLVDVVQLSSVSPIQQPVAAEFVQCSVPILQWPRNEFTLRLAASMRPRPFARESTPSVVFAVLIRRFHRIEQLREELGRACNHSDPRLARFLPLVWVSERCNQICKLEVRIDE